MRTITCIVILIAACVTMTGCHSVNVDETPILDRYYMTNIGQSTSADIIAALGPIDQELMSQSESVIATWTEEDLHGKLYWFNMVAFDEDELGIEVDLVLTYQLVEGMNVDLVGAYLFAGDATSSDGDNDENPYELGTRFSISF